MKQRNAFAVAAHFRRAATFHHKTEARGGARNTQRDIMSDEDTDTGDTSPFWENVEADEGDGADFSDCE
jgi:hypothetical protein